MCRTRKQNHAIRRNAAPALDNKNRGNEPNGSQPACYQQDPARLPPRAASSSPPSSTPSKSFPALIKPSSPCRDQMRRPAPMISAMLSRNSMTASGSACNYLGLNGRERRRRGAPDWDGTGSGFAWRPARRASAGALGGCRNATAGALFGSSAPRRTSIRSPRSEPRQRAVHPEWLENTAAAGAIRICRSPRMAEKLLNLTTNFKFNSF